MTHGSVQPANSEVQNSHGISVGVNYVQKFDAIDIAVSGGHRAAQAPDIPANLEDPKLWSAGVNIGFAGFTVGGSFVTADSNTGDADGAVGVLGLKYDF